MEYSQETIATGAKGRREARILRSCGKDFAIYGYLDIESGQMLAKYSILLRHGDGSIEHLFIVPGIGKKELVVKHTEEKDAKARWVFDGRSKKALAFWE